MRKTFFAITRMTEKASTEDNARRKTPTSSSCSHRRTSDAMSSEKRVHIGVGPRSSPRCRAKIRVSLLLFQCTKEVRFSRPTEFFDALCFKTVFSRRFFFEPGVLRLRVFRGESFRWKCSLVQEFVESGFFFFLSTRFSEPGFVDPPSPVKLTEKCVVN